VTFGWGCHTLGDILFLAHEYFSDLKAIQSSTYREMLGVTRRLQALVEQCKGEFAVLQVDAMNLIGVTNRINFELSLNDLARGPFGFAFNAALVTSLGLI